MERAYDLDHPEDGYPLVPHAVAGRELNEAEELLRLIEQTEADLLDAVDALHQDDRNPLA